MTGNRFSATEPPKPKGDGTSALGILREVLLFIETQGFSNIHSVAKYQEKREDVHSETLKHFRTVSQFQRKAEGDPLVSPSIVFYAKKKKQLL